MVNARSAAGRLTALHGGVVMLLGHLVFSQCLPHVSAVARILKWYCHLVRASTMRGCLMSGRGGNSVGSGGNSTGGASGSAGFTVRVPVAPSCTHQKQRSVDRLHLGPSALCAQGRTSGTFGTAGFDGARPRGALLQVRSGCVLKNRHAVSGPRRRSTTQPPWRLSALHHGAGPAYSLHVRGGQQDAAASTSH